MPCWDHDAVDSPPSGGLFCVVARQGMIMASFD